MKILFIIEHTHIKNFNFVQKCKIIDFTIIYSVHEINNFDLSNFDFVFSPCKPIDVSKYPNTKFLFGPHFSIFPEKNDMDIIRGENAIYIQPCPWARDVWVNNLYCNNIKMISMPFGVDTEKFNYFNNQPRTKVFVYFKTRHPEELEFLLNFLNSKNIEFRIFNYQQRYPEEEYLNCLQQSKYAIWLGRHESQGFALEEALSCNIPLLVWNTKYMSQEYGAGYDNIPACTIPYWDESCGEFFYEKEELENTFNKFISKLDTYKPREYILENLSIEKCEERFLALNAHP